MSNNVKDVGIIGCGVAGAFAVHKIATKYKDTSVIAFEIGRPWAKRRVQLLGWLGCLPNSDGKFYTSDIKKVANITGNRRANSAYNQMFKVLSNINDFTVVKDHVPNKQVMGKIAKHGYSLSTNDYIQMYPSEIHALSKYMAGEIEPNKNITFKFDSEVLDISKNKKIFTIRTEHNEAYQCKKLIIAVGRGGWRWANDLFTKFGIIDNNDVARFGIRVEMSSSYLKEFHKSNCYISGNGIEVGPLSWFGTVIPEDHTDMAISAFRSNESRWKTDKVSFNLIGNRPFLDAGFNQTDRIGKLMFVLANDRIIKERISSILSGKSKVSMLKEYDWLKDSINQLSHIMPEIVNKGYFYTPTIIPLAPQINLGSDFSSEVENMFVIGESAGVSGILAAGMMGTAVASAVCK
jgi:hypothetical protein